LAKTPRDPAQLAKLVVNLAVEAADMAVTTSGSIPLNPQHFVQVELGLKAVLRGRRLSIRTKGRKLLKRPLTSAGRSAVWIARSILDVEEVY
jgi:hypothetical protein